MLGLSHKPRKFQESIGLTLAPGGGTGIHKGTIQDNMVQSVGVFSGWRHIVKENQVLDGRVEGELPVEEVGFTLVGQLRV